jgi:hypothetical protein
VKNFKELLNNNGPAFGKYKDSDKDWSTIVNEDPEYILWLFVHSSAALPIDIVRKAVRLVRFPEKKVSMTKKDIFEDVPW